MSKYIGDVSAYAYAVSQGYTGTEEEFAELMASYAEVAESAAESARQAAASATSAGQSATNAAGSASTANTKAGEAATSAQTATTKAGEAATSANNAAGSATTASNAANTATTKASEASQSAANAAASATTANSAADDATAAKTASETAQTAAETAQGKAEEAAEQAEETLNTYARVDGYYQDMTVGDAEQLVATVGIEDKVPYLFRTSGGSADIGDREVDKIVGGTIAWNQIYPTHTTYNVQSGDVSALSINVSNGYLNVVGTATADAQINIGPNTVDVPANHVCLILCDGWDGFAWRRSGFAPKNASYYMNKHSANFQGSARINTVSGTTYNIHARFSTYDLTQMFGTTIADYLYTLEQTTAGAGVAWFKKLFPKDYYAYNAGELKSVEGLTSHDMVGFNQWDEEWEVGTIGNTGQNYVSDDRIRSKNYIHVIPNTTYYITIGDGSYYMYLWGYDADKNYVGRVPDSQLQRGNVTMPNWCHYIRFAVHPNYGTTYKNDICINLSWDGQRNGEYEPYEVHSYPLDSSLTLRGIPKLDSANNLYYDGDTYESDGTVTRKYGIVTLNGAVSEVSWQVNTVTQGTLWRIPIADMKTGGNAANIICDKFIWKKSSERTEGSISQAYSNYIDFIYTDASIDTIAKWKSYLSTHPITVIYELATPTTESAEPYINPQIVDDFGTEEYVTDNIVPVGHETQYRPNLRAKLEMAPDSPSGDGDYIVRQANGMNSYVPITFPADELPSAPTTNGTYVLKCTVTASGTTYTWEAQ